MINPAPATLPPGLYRGGNGGANGHAGSVPIQIGGPTGKQGSSVPAGSSSGGGGAGYNGQSSNGGDGGIGIGKPGSQGSDGGGNGFGLTSRTNIGGSGDVVIGYYSYQPSDTSYP